MTVDKREPTQREQDLLHATGRFIGEAITKSLAPIVAQQNELLRQLGALKNEMTVVKDRLDKLKGRTDA